MKLITLLVFGLLVVMISTTSCATTSTSEQTKKLNTTSSNMVLKDLWSVEALQGQFMEDSQKPRLILLFSPT
ncbi:MAG: hypothetical protein ACJ0J7_06500 [Tepidiformaceae bacterium]